ncbi:cytochrome c [Undibacterium terreum]|uniref:Cytochrome c n=1 Tax=Undibacterium terreum TaxID=1224302 RepID=A0A916UG38_9BURK|nr:cytochrome c [Undibacterium terreum]GGC71052.1 cytochrome c [Undibacterium terreum]
MKRLLIPLSWLLLFVVIVLIAMGFYGYMLGNEHGGPAADNGRSGSPTHAELVARGAYLARAGNCMGCHTLRGAPAYAGGRSIQTPFGNFYTPNITPDKKTGIGSWTEENFWQSIHAGKSRDGSMLYPAFPYPNYTRITRADSDALFAYLQSIPAAEQANQPHDLRFPYNQRALLGIWRALYFSPEVYQQDTAQTADWNRGAYLVQGLGHCSACHTSRNALGASINETLLGGGILSGQEWYAPSLTSENEVGLGRWQTSHVNDLLKTGATTTGSVTGPMAEVVAQSLQHLTDADINAMSVYLKSLPQKRTDPADKEIMPAFLKSTVDFIMGKNVSQAEQLSNEAVLKAGASLYKTHCMDCHQAGGEGVAQVYPPLKANHKLMTSSVANPIRMVLAGGFAPATAGNPRPYGMPPFGPKLSDDEVAAVVSYIRNSWGNQAPMVSPSDVNKYRTAPLD